jgi:hypothetical protein
MPKCGMTSCSKVAIGGFQETKGVGSVDYPNATIPGLATHWSATEEALLRRTASGQPEDWINPKGLAELADRLHGRVRCSLAL